MGKVFSVGDQYNLECPHCGKNNTYICQGQKIPFEQKVFCFQKPCFFCKQVIYCQVNWQMNVVAEPFDPLNPPK